MPDVAQNLYREMLDTSRTKLNSSNSQGTSLYVITEAREQMMLAKQYCRIREAIFENKHDGSPIPDDFSA